MKQARDGLEKSAAPLERRRQEKNQAESIGLHPLLQLQHKAGNQAVIRLLESQRPHQAGRGKAQLGAAFSTARARVIPTGATTHQPGIQRKQVDISQPTDAAEREADDVARRVVAGQSAEIHGTRGTISRKGEGSTATTPEFQSQLASSNGGGRSLDESTRSEMESRIGEDFSHVKIHTGSEAHNLSEDVRARAFTHGQNIFFGQGEFNPHSRGGKELLAHELTHTVQQQGGSTLQADGPNRTESSNAVLHPLHNHHSGNTQSIQRKGKAAPAPDITDKEVAAAFAWATKTDLGKEAIKELQGALGVDEDGVYDDATVRAVFAKQSEWQPKGAISNAGKATPAVFRRLGLISTKTITTATVADKEFEQIKTLFPDGVTVAIAADYKKSVEGRTEFLNQTKVFAKNQNAVGLKNGAVALGVPVLIKALGEVIEAVQGIRRGLLKKYEDDLKASGKTEDESQDEPLFTKIKNLALFSHGEVYGVGMNESNAFRQGGLHHTAGATDTPSGVADTATDPANVEAFVRGISSALAPELRVELFACSAGDEIERIPFPKPKDPKHLTKEERKRNYYKEWIEPKQGDVAGETSIAGRVGSELVVGATVSEDTTVGHTTENYAARVFGSEAGGSPGGVHMFNLMYDESFIQAELTRLFPDKTAEERAALHDCLRDQMWEHYKDSVGKEHKRPKKDKRYDVPMGQEMFIDPDNAKELFHNDWNSNLIPDRLADCKPAAPKKSKKTK